MNTVALVVRKRRLHHTTRTPPRQGRPSNLNNPSKYNNKIMREATARPTVTLKELQSTEAESGVKVNQTTISRALYSWGLDGRLARKKHHDEPYECISICVFWWDATRIQNLGKFQSTMCGANLTQAIPQLTPSLGWNTVVEASCSGTACHSQNLGFLSQLKGE